MGYHENYTAQDIISKEQRIKFEMISDKTFIKQYKYLKIMNFKILYERASSLKNI